MDKLFSSFEKIVRKAGQFTHAKSEPVGGLHPFQERNIHASLPKKVLKLFDDGHYPEATFEAFKFLDNEVKRHSGINKSGTNLMEEAFTVKSPLIKLTLLATQNEIDEQSGFQRIFSGSILAIRNPRGHGFNLIDTLDQCLDHLGLASLLIRRLEDAGYKCINIP